MARRSKQPPPATYPESRRAWWARRWSQDPERKRRLRARVGPCEKVIDVDDTRRRSGAGIAVRVADLSPRAGHVRARRRRAPLRRRRARVSRSAVWHRRGLARPRASRALARDRRAGAHAHSHVESVVSPVAGAARRAPRESLRPAARVFLQERHRSRRSLPEVRAALLVHARGVAAGIHRDRGILSRADVRVALG